MSHLPFSSATDHILIRDEHGEYKPASTGQLIEAARRAMQQLVQRGAQMSSPAHVKDYLTVMLAGLEHEVFSVIFLDSQNRLIEYVELFRGTVDGASVYPREVVKEALARNAAAVILAHNHPSGWPEPSDADCQITKRLRQALALVDVRVLDHLVVGGEQAVSLAERGLI